MTTTYTLNGLHSIGRDRIRNASGTKGSVFVDCTLTVHDARLHDVLVELFANEDSLLIPTCDQPSDRVRVRQVTVKEGVWYFTAYASFGDVRSRFWYRKWRPQELRQAPTAVLHRLQLAITLACRDTDAELSVAAVQHELSVCG